MDDAPGRTVRVMELTARGALRSFLLAVPAAQVLALRDRRLQEMGLDPEAAGPPGASPARPSAPWLDPLRQRLDAAALSDACDRAGQRAVEALLAGRGIEPAGTPRVETLARPPGRDLVLLAEVETLPEVEPPDPAALRLECLTARPDPAEAERALAALAAGRADWAPLPHGACAEPGDLVVCDVAAALVPPENRLPRPGLDGAAAGEAGRLPEGWVFGDNHSRLASRILEVATGENPPRLRIRIAGQAPSDGQSYVCFVTGPGLPAAPGSGWAGSLSVRALGQPVGLRGVKLRLDSKARGTLRALRRKDAAVPLEGAGFARTYVSDSLPEPETGFVRFAVLFDHLAGPVDFTLDLAAPRLVEGLDLGLEAPVPLPEFSGRGRRFEIGGPPDPAGLLPHLDGIAAGESREVLLRLPRSLDDRAVAGQAARFVVRATAVLRRAPPPVDAALARALGFEGIEALHGWAAGRVAQHALGLARRQARRAVLDALTAAAGEVPLPEEAVRAEFSAIWPRLASGPGAVPDRAAAMALAAQRVRLGLVLRALARCHGIAVTEEDLREAADPQAPPPAPEELRRRALEDRVVAFVLDRAQVTRREVSLAELAAAAKAWPSGRVDAPWPGA